MWFISYIYEITFNNLDIIKDFMYNEMKKNILKYDNEINKFKTNKEGAVIELLRPYVNKTIFEINSELSKIEFDLIKTEELELEETPLKKKDKSVKNTGIFILGGDAFRRYNKDISISNDIDAKIYIPLSIPFEYIDNDDPNNIYAIKNQQKIFTCISNNLIKLLVYLENNKKTLFNELIRLNSYKEFGDDNKVIININFITEDPNMVNFKFRKSGKPQFPVDLYSIDYRCIFNIEYCEKTITIPVDIPFIDVVVKQEGYNYFNNYSVMDENGLTFAKLEFLLSDLLNTYNNDDLSLLRFFAGKSTKDYERLNTIWDIYFNQKKNPLYTINNKTIHFISEENKDNNKKLNTISDYSINTTLDDSGDKLYISIMEIVNEYVRKKKTNDIKKIFNNYNKIGGKLNKKGGFLFKSSLPLPSPSLQLKEPLSLQLKEPLKKEIFEYNYNDITNELIELIKLSNNNMKRSIEINEDYNEKIDTFNNYFYIEFAKILTPENEFNSSLYFTNEEPNIKRLNNNINIFFNKKK